MTKYNTIEEVIINEGDNLEYIDLTDVNLIRSDLSDIKLPKDVNLFQKIKGKSLFGVTLPEGDYSEYDFEGVNITSTKFTPNSILPNNKNLFKLIYRSELYGTHLPTIDLNNYDFEGVCIAGAVFTKNSIFSDDIDFFQKIYNKNVYKTTLPTHDYSTYDFHDVNVVATNFQEDSPFETDNTHFFQTVRDKCFIATILPESLVKKIQYYDLQDVEIDLNMYKLNIDTLALIKYSQPTVPIKIKGELMSIKRNAKTFTIKQKK